MKYLLFTLSVLICSNSFAQKPVIADFNPETGSIGSTVSIIGTGFHPNKDSNIVYIGNIRANVKEVGSSHILITIPKGAGSKKFSVTASGLTGYSRKSFALVFDGANKIYPNSFVRALNDSSQINFSYSKINNADLDNDGRIDVVGTQSYFNMTPNTDPNNTSSILIQQNLTTPTSVKFGGIQKYTAGNTLDEVSIGDFDGDGKLDIVAVSVYTHTIHIFKNISDSGKIKMSNSIDYLIDTSRGMPQNLAYNANVSVADINDDGKPDIVAGIGIYSGFAVFINKSTTNKIEFDKPIIFSKEASGANNINTGAPRSILISDLNADNKPDILFCNTFPDQTILALLNNSTNNQVRFDSTLKIPSLGGIFLNPIIAGDFNGDGLTDIIGANYFNEGITFFRNTSVNDKLAFAKGLSLKNPPCTLR